MRTTINHFIDSISKQKLDGVFNPWAESCSTELDPLGHESRRARLTLHLECESPGLLLVGEAPGYQGCRYSGIAFCSERQLLDGVIPRMPNMQGARITSRMKPWSEPSATIVWKALYLHGIAERTVMFNAFPWHPEGKNGPHSNRTPTKQEQSIGLTYLNQFLALFPGVPIAALGKTAGRSLDDIGARHTTLRHPANGGSPAFNHGLAEWVCQRKVIM